MEQKVLLKTGADHRGSSFNALPSYNKTKNCFPVPGNLFCLDSFIVSLQDALSETLTDSIIPYLFFIPAVSFLIAFV